MSRRTYGFHPALADDTMPQALDLSRKSNVIDSEESPESPNKKNKRKMSEPRKRTDFSIKRFCPEPSRPGSVEEQEEDTSSPPGSPPSDRLNRGSDAETATSSSPETIRPPGHLPFPYFAGPGGVYPVYMPIPYGYLPSYPPTNIPVFTKEYYERGTNPRPTTSPTPRPISPRNDNTAGSSRIVLEEEDSHSSARRRKNYKNMTRERRIEANARERTRVHTISAAFEKLRRAVPSYSHNQKLSKLAILRIASSYILALAKLADLDYSKDKKEISFAECVDMCTNTINSEGRARRRH